MQPSAKRVIVVLLLLFCISGAEAGNTSVMTQSSFRFPERVQDSATRLVRRYVTAKLEQLAQLIPHVNFDSLPPGVHTEYTFQGRPLKIRVNQWNEIEHIGFNFFDTLISAEYPIVCDFLERYFLELTVSDDPDKFLRMTINNFHIEYGAFETIFTINPKDEMVVVSIDLQKYQVTFKRDGELLLSYIFDMDYQMLVGSNSIELEHNYLRTIQREVEHAPVIPLSLPLDIDTCTDLYYYAPGSTYLMEAIHNGRYYVITDCVWVPVCSAHKPIESAYNILLSPVALGDFLFDIELDMYGYKTESFSVPVDLWIAKTMAEGCTPYLGIKDIKDNVVRATLFCPNMQAGYCHVVSVKLPLSVIHERGGKIDGRMYAYVPMHNITPGYIKSLK